MSQADPNQERSALNEKTRAAWEAIAAIWDQRMGAAGNAFQRVLVGPASERLLDVQPGQTILDVACGSGIFSRRLAEMGANVVACDFSAAFIERARARGGERIDYHVVDATDEAQLLALGPGRFDAAVCTMALMDMATLEPLFSALRRLLKPGRPCVFSVMHPCFNNSGTHFLVEAADQDGRSVRTHSIKVTEYLGLQPTRGLGLSNQPVPHYYFHRPLHVLLGAAFRAGFSLDGLEEPAFGPEHAEPQNPLSWVNYHAIPPVLVARVRSPR